MKTIWNQLTYLKGLSRCRGGGVNPVIVYHRYRVALVCGLEEGKNTLYLMVLLVSICGTPTEFLNHNMLLPLQTTSFGFPVDQRVAHGANNAKVMGLNPREKSKVKSQKSKSWQALNFYEKLQLYGFIWFSFPCNSHIEIRIAILLATYANGFSMQYRITQCCSKCLVLLHISLTMHPAVFTF